MSFRELFATVARQPVVHFLVIGALLSVALRWVSDDVSGSDPATIRITQADIAQLDAGWRARWNRPPTPDELSGLINAQVRELALHRQALAMGLDRNEPVIRRVLVQKLEQIARNLIELSLAPTDQDLEKYYAERAEEYRPPRRITFTHVFLDPDRRGEQTLADAERMLAELRARGAPTEEMLNLSDSFMLQSYYPEKDQQRIANLFGHAFARAVFELTPGQWHGPVLSGYGMHLVYVEAITEYPTPSLEDLRDRVTQDWIDENRERITDQYFADLIAQYDIVIERRLGDEPVEPAPAPGT